MAVSYKKLFHLLIERDITTSQLQQQVGFSANNFTRVKRIGMYRWTPLKAYAAR